MRETRNASSTYNNEDEEEEGENYNNGNEADDADDGATSSSSSRRKRMHASLDALLYAGVHTALLSLALVVLQMWLSYGAAECPKPPAF